jgi:hypothetical protein
MHPYSQLPDRAFWKRSVSNTAWRDLQLAAPSKFPLNASTKVATAGSCFAQHITRHLNAAGTGIYITESAHPLVAQFGGEVDSYRLFSARYGNIYSARQCLEMFNQAFGRAPVILDLVEQDGRFYDLLRPNAIPNGFATWDQARADRLFHLRCVKTLFETADVFVFTLGLTETWHNLEGRYTYPVCPGTARGSYDPRLHLFRNFSYPEVLADLEALVSGLAGVNAALKVILTVSPVPLVATNTDKNVLIASSYSKSILRAACGYIDSLYDHVQYFPSFEIVSSAASFGQYLASDLREVSERGVAHVMQTFFSTFFSDSLTQSPRPTGGGTTLSPAPGVPDAESSHGLVAKAMALECEELFNDVT